MFSTIIPIQLVHSQGLFGEKLNDLLGEFSENLSPGSTTFNSTLTLVNTTNLASQPLLAASGKNVYVAWVEDDNLNNSSLYLRTSNDGGLTFGDTKQISNKVSSSIGPQLVSSGKNVYLAWSFEMLDNNSLMFAKSNDNGSTFEKANRIDEIGEFQFPRLASSNDNVYLAWMQENQGVNKILFKASADGGVTFNDTMILANNSELLTGPALSVSENVVYVVWADLVPGKSTVFFKSSSDGGSNFEETVIVGNKSKFFDIPILKSSGKSVHLSWQDGTHQISKILFKTSSDGGMTFHDTPDLVNKTGLSKQFLSASPNNVYLLWKQGGFNNDSGLYFLASNDGGNSFGEALRISNQTGNSNSYSLDSNDTDVHVLWTTNDALLYKVSVNGGVEFEDVKTIFKNNTDTGFPIFPLYSSLVVEGKNVYVAWTVVDTTSSNVGSMYSILFKKGVGTRSP